MIDVYGLGEKVRERDRDREKDMAVITLCREQITIVAVW